MCLVSTRNNLISKPQLQRPETLQDFCMRYKLKHHRRIFAYLINSIFKIPIEA